MERTRGQDDHPTAKRQLSPIPACSYCEYPFIIRLENLDVTLVQDPAAGLLQRLFE